MSENLKPTDCSSTANSCSSCTQAECDSKQNAQKKQINAKLSLIKQKIVVLSGKGGVGKSTVAVNLAIGLAKEGMKVGLLDVDIHGPSVPMMLGIADKTLEQVGDQLLPVTIGSLSVMSIGFMLQNRNDAIIWRGPMKTNIIQQFIENVNWGELDYLIVDCPPGTGDEPLSVCQVLNNPEGAIIVTTPQNVATNDVRKSITFCQKINLPIMGVVENMSGFSCPHCNKITHIFKADGGKNIAKEFDIPFLGSLPIAPEIAISGDSGEPFIHKFADSQAGKAFAPVVNKFLTLTIPQTK